MQAFESSPWNRRGDCVQNHHKVMERDQFYAAGSQHVEATQDTGFFASPEGERLGLLRSGTHCRCLAPTELSGSNRWRLQMSLAQ